MNESNFKKILTSKKGILLISTICCFLWGSAFPSLKYSYNVLGISNIHFSYDIQFGSYRFLISAAIVFVFILILRLDLRIKKEHLPKLFVLALLQTTISYVFFFIGVSNTSSVNASILQSTSTFFAVITPHFFYADDKMNLRKSVGLLFGISGVLLMSLSGGSVKANFTFTGEGFLIISSLINALSIIYAKNTSREMNPIVMTFYSLLIGSVLMLLISLPFTGGNVIPVTLSFVPMLVYLGFISSAAITLWYLIVKYNKIAEVSINKFQIPIWGVILSAIFIKGEILNIFTFISLGLVCLGIIVVSSGDTDKNNLI